MKNFIISFKDTEHTIEMSADSWNIDKDNLLTFYRYGNGNTSKKISSITVFNMNNILNFREIKEENKYK